MHNKNVLLGVTGGIAAYKSADLIRRLREQGAEVRVVMTKASKEFITPLTLQALSGNPVHDDLLDTKAESAMGHIALARWADVVVIAPASADFIAKLNAGRADDLLSTICLATVAPIVVAPAMNQRMWLDKITQQNIKRLKSSPFHQVGPTMGSQACGDIGPGRMAEPSEIIKYLEKLFHPGLLEGCRVLLTAGPTREYLDPVRFISNVSSGKMSYALAESLVEAGAVVMMVTGRTALAIPKHVKAIQIETADEMLENVMKHIEQQDIFIGAAAVCDFRPEHFSRKKIEKNQHKVLQVKLVPNPDILASVGKLASCPFIVGFAAQTEKLLEQAKKKLNQKNCDLVIANLVGKSDRGFESDDNAATVIWKNGKKTFALMSKKQLARQFIPLIAEHYHAKRAA